MTQEQRKMAQAATGGILAARVELDQARELLAEAAKACKGDPIEDRLNSWYDELTDLIYDYKKVWKEWRDNLDREDKFPESWKEAI